MVAVGLVVAVVVGVPVAAGEVEVDPKEIIQPEQQTQAEVQEVVHSSRQAVLE